MSETVTRSFSHLEVSEVSLTSRLYIKDYLSRPYYGLGPVKDF